MVSQRRRDVRIRPYAASDLDLLQRLLGDAGMMRDLGGPESAEAIWARHQRYLESTPESGGLFTIETGPAGAPVGWVGYWETMWRDQVVWESGWHVLPEFQGQGLAASGAARMIELVNARPEHRFLYSFPSVANSASNALCRRLGFSLLGEAEVEYPKGRVMLSNEWRHEILCG